MFLTFGRAPWVIDEEKVHFQFLMLFDLETAAADTL
jgi:hypothetical protein